MKKIMIIIMAVAILTFATNPEILELSVDTASFIILEQDSVIYTGSYAYTDSLVVFDSLVNISGCKMINYSPESDSTFLHCDIYDSVYIGRWEYTDSIFADSNKTIKWQGSLIYSAMDSEADSMGVWLNIIIDSQSILVDSMWGDLTIYSSMDNVLNFTFTINHKNWNNYCNAKVELFADDINKKYPTSIFYKKPTFINTDSAINLVIEKVNYPYATVDSIRVDAGVNGDFLTLSTNTHEWQAPSVENVNYNTELNIFLSNGIILKDTVKILVFENLPPYNLKQINASSHLDEFTITYDYYMDSTEITQKLYDSIMSDLVWGYSDYTKPAWTTYSGVGDNYPAYYVNWYDAVLFCNARSKNSGLDTVYSYTSVSGIPGNDCTLDSISINYNSVGYRLPTEDEWELAYRAGSITDFYWGKNYDPYPSSVSDNIEINSYAVWSGSSYDSGSGHEDYGVHEVAGKLPNIYNLYDMAGNLNEWCNDWHSYGNNLNRIDYTGDTTGMSRTYRGGAWLFGATNLKANSYSIPKYPYDEDAYGGFRCVLAGR